MRQQIKLFVKNGISFTMTFDGRTEQGQSYSGPSIHHKELSCQNKLRSSPVQQAQVEGQMSGHSQPVQI